MAESTEFYRVLEMQRRFAEVDVNWRPEIAIWVHRAWNELEQLPEDQREIAMALAEDRMNACDAIVAARAALL